MASGCPVCEQPLPPMAPGCTTCGYPTALALDALRALSDGDPQPVVAAAAPPARRRTAASPAPPDPQAELCQRIAGETDAHLGILQELGGDTQEIGSDLRQAALAQVEGRTTEALDILRRALGRVQERSVALFERRVAELEQRDAVLRASGVGTSFSEESPKMRAAFEAGRQLEAIALLRESDQRLGRIEGDWKGLQGLLKQIETLRGSIRDTGGDAPEVEENVQQIRRLLAGPGVTVEGLDTASQLAARAVMVLHEALPEALGGELERHARSLTEYPAEHPRARSAREMHADAVRHLRRGRLPEATSSLRQLRAALKELAAAPAPVSPATTPRAATATPPAIASAGAPAAAKPDALARLLEKARGLAARVRTLPADSEIAYEAAAEIRLATELLRARKLDEAEATLTRLMHTLDAEAPAGR